MAEFEHVGKRCEVCNFVDFLPLECSFCGKNFCKDHGPSIFHPCTPEIEIKKIDYNNQNKTTSDFVSCKHCSQSVSILETSVCYKCHKRYCLIHRQQVDHECEALAKNRAEKDEDERKRRALIESQKAQVKELLKNLNHGIVPKARTPKNIEFARKIAVMKLKSSAAGESSVPFEERLFFYLAFVPNENSYGQQSRAFTDKGIFLSREWSIGKVVDWIAMKFDLINKNNDIDKPSFVLTTDSILENLQLLDDNNSGNKDDEKFCCSKKNLYFCFDHCLKELEEKKLLSSGDRLACTYLLLQQ